MMSRFGVRRVACNRSGVLYSASVNEAARRGIRLALMLLLGLIFWPTLTESARAACDTSGNPVVIDASCDDFVIGSAKSGATIKQPATLSPFFGNQGALINSSGKVTGTFLNQGTITSGFGRDGLVNQGTITTLQNEGTITSRYSSGDYAAIANSGDIGTLLNKGTISATVGNFGNGAHAILQVGNIGTLENYGTISAQNSAIYFQPAFSRRIETLFNAGTIEGGINGGGSNTFASAIVLGPGSSIGSIINTGVIDHSVCQGSNCFAAIDNQGGSIDTITNLGKLSSGNTNDSGYGIINSVTGRIGTLNNDQVDLKYFGTLPQNYLAIVYGLSNYAKMAVTNASGVMNFGVDAAAPIGSSTYVSVLTGIDESNLAATSGSWGGGLFNNTWVLSSSAPSQWDLTLTSQPIVPSVETGSGESLAGAIIKTVTTTASEVVTPETIVPTLVNGVTLQQAAQTLTTPQASQLSRVTAEGYSSNLTIGLQQMGMISDAVTDRIYGQSSIGNAVNSGDCETDQGRHIWIDGSATHGQVNGYDGLSGFSYNLYDVVAGADLLRDSAGGLGVFGGVGYSAMSESEHVPQDFSTTSYFAGLYGGRDLAETVRLSGAAGYVYGRNDAERQNEDIGQFTGGTARSDYATNGIFGTLKIAKSMVVEDVTVTPFAGLSYAQLWMDSAEESGGGDFNYTISSATAYTTVVFIGGDFVAPLSQGADALSLVGFARLGYDVFANDDGAHTITANSSIYGSFDQVGADMGPVLSSFGLGIMGNAANGLSGRIGAVAALNSNGYQFGAGGELRW